MVLVTKEAKLRLRQGRSLDKLNGGVEGVRCICIRARAGARARARRRKAG